MLLLLLTTHTVAQASAADGFIRHRPFDPLTASFGLPAAAARPAPGRREVQAALEHGNIFTGGSTTNEMLLLDGESTRVALRLTQPVSPCLAFEASGALLSHDGGVFDRAIDDWHQWFGLPDADRGQAEMFELDYRYENTDGRALRVSGSAQGVGDISVSVQRRWHCADIAGPVLRAGIKLPTGAAGSLLGSGTTDGFADLQSSLWQPGSRLSVAGIVGLLVPGRADDYPDQRSLVAYGTLAARWSWRPRVMALLQFDARSALFDSDLPELGSHSTVLTAGVRALSAGGDAYDITIAEDIVIDTAPDIVLRLGWTRNF